MDWYVVQSKPKQETRAEENLRAWNVETLLPKVLRSPRSGESTRPRTEPMFPGYLFARFDVGEMSGKVRHTRGVSKILGTLEGPTPLGEHVIDEIRDRMDPSGVVRLTSLLRPGDRVRVVGGPFRNFLGVFEHSASAAQRVTLLLATLNTQVRVALDAHLVERFS